jgi:hypothetical protein
LLFLLLSALRISGEMCSFCFYKVPLVWGVKRKGNREGAADEMASRLGFIRTSSQQMMSA